MDNFAILGDIIDKEVIATSSSIRDIRRLRRDYGRGRWRKMKGIARVRIPNAGIYRVEIHWYEANNIGKREFKIKRFFHD